MIWVRTMALFLILFIFSMMSGCLWWADEGDDYDPAADVCAKAFECMDNIDSTVFVVFGEDEMDCVDTWEAIINPEEEDTKEDEDSEEEPANIDYTSCAELPDCDAFISCLGLSPSTDEEIE